MLSRRLKQLRLVSWRRKSRGLVNAMLLTPCLNMWSFVFSTDRGVATALHTLQLEASQARGPQEQKGKKIALAIIWVENEIARSLDYDALIKGSLRRTRLERSALRKYWIMTTVYIYIVHCRLYRCRCKPVHNTKSVSEYIINTAFWLVHGDVRGSPTGVWRGHIFRCYGPE